MKNILITLACFLFIFTLQLDAKSEKALPLTESSQVSLLTCTPSDDAVYALFGHSGLRVRDDSLNLDVVFDYGVFDFEADNFILRFVKGETDYMVGDRPFQRFMMEYTYRSMGVSEQIFNLSLSERQMAFDALTTNSLPENRVYRYNFFYDNCATRPRDIIVNNIDGVIEYIPFTKDQTYRDLLDECLILTPWVRFGINIVIGSGADKVINERQKDFLPIYVSTALSKANIQAEADTRPLVKQTAILLLPQNSPLALQEAKEKNSRATDEPLIAGILLLLIALLVSYLSHFKRKVILGKIFDTLLFLVAGITGCIIFFLMFFSEHPCVDANWNFVWLNPLVLLVVPFFFVKSCTKYVISYHFVNFVVLTLFLLGMIFVPQKMDIAFIPYILALCLRSGVNVWDYKQFSK